MLQDSFQMPPDWHEQGLCAGHPDPELWWYKSSKIREERRLQILRMVEAVQICNECPVRELCLKQGLEQDNLHGGSIWGGLMNWERRTMLKKPSQNSFKDEAYMVAQVRKKVARVA